MQELSGLILGLDPKLAAIIIVAVCYFIIFTEKVNRAVIALLGAAVNDSQRYFDTENRVGRNRF